MYTSAQILLDHHATCRAHLRGVGWVHGHHLRTGTLSLVRKQLSELRQTGVVGAKGQMAIYGGAGIVSCLTWIVKPEAVLVQRMMVEYWEMKRGKGV